MAGQGWQVSEEEEGSGEEEGLHSQEGESLCGSDDERADQSKHQSKRGTRALNVEVQGV